MISLLIALILVVLVLWAARTLLPALGLPPTIQTVIYVVIVVLAVIWFLGHLAPLVR